MIQYKVVTSLNSQGLQNQVMNLVKEGWKPKGSHKVVETHRQNRFSGTQHMDTTIQHEYSQTMIKTKFESPKPE